MSTGNIKIWWREDPELSLEIGRSKFEVHDTGISVDKFDTEPPEVFGEIYRMFGESEFVAKFAGGSRAKLEVGDVIEAGQVFDTPRIGMLIDFPHLHQLMQKTPLVFVKIDEKMAIADVWMANFKPLRIDE